MVEKVKDFKIVENKLLNRSEISATLSFDSATPQKKVIKEKICTTLAINPELAVVRKIKNKYGLKEVDVIIHAYQNKEILMKTEPYYILVREGLAQKKEKKEKQKTAPQKSK